MSDKTADWWKFTATALMGIVLSSSVWTFATWNNPSRDDVSQMIEDEESYPQDRALIMDALEREQREIESLRDDVRQLVASQSALTAKIDLYISRME